MTRRLFFSGTVKYLCLIYLLCWPVLILPQTQEDGKLPAQASATLTASLAEVQQKRGDLAGEIKQIKQLLKTADSRDQPRVAEVRSNQLQVLQELDTVYVQQLAGLQNAVSLSAEQQQYRDDLAALKQPQTDAPVSFVELDRAREEQDGQLARSSSLKAKAKQTQTELARAKEQLQARQQELANLGIKVEHDDSDLLAQSRLALAQARLTLAQQSLALSRIETDNAKLALQVYGEQAALSEQHLSLLMQQAVFTEDELKAQVQDIEKQEFGVKRELTKAKEAQLNTSQRLTEARQRLAVAPVEKQLEFKDEAEAKRLADEGAKVTIELLNQRLELLSDWKTVWQRRYAVFNQLEKADWLKWKQAANAKIDDLNRDERQIPLWLNDWQKQLITVDNELAGLKDGESQARWIRQQSRCIQEIIDSYREQKTFLENSRRLQQKLVDLIEDRSSHRTLTERLQSALDFEVYGNRLGHWLVSVATAAGLFSLLVFVRNFLIVRLQAHAEADADKSAALFFASVRRTTTFFLFMISMFSSALWLSLDSSNLTWLKHLTMIALIIQGAIWLSYFFSTWIKNYLGARARRDATSKGALSIFNFMSQAAVWSVALLLMLQNIGIDVTALATGLGIGGVAVALALQRILGDLFSSLSIVLDKPFVSGDFIIVDQVLGTVEHIGIKTTRIRSLDGEQIICANSDLLNTRIRNFQRMQERRVAFQIGVVYQTDLQRLARIPDMLKQIVEAQGNSRFDRAHFKSYGDFALIYEIVYYVHSPDYNLYMDIQQAINLAIFKGFQEDGIEFAYPTQSILLQSALPALTQAEPLPQGT